MMQKNEARQTVEKQAAFYFARVPKLMYLCFLIVSIGTFFTVPVYADGLFDTVKNAMSSVYKDIAGISTVAAVVCSAVCLFLMNFSKSGRTVDESRMWLKRIVICWAAIMLMGAIVTYFEGIIPQSTFSG